MPEWWRWASGQLAAAWALPTAQPFPSKCLPCKPCREPLATERSPSNRAGTVKAEQPRAAPHPQCPVPRLRKRLHHGRSTVGHTECSVVQLLERGNGLLRPQGPAAQNREHQRNDAPQAMHSRQTQLTAYQPLSACGSPKRGILRYRLVGYTVTLAESTRRCTEDKCRHEREHRSGK